MGSLCDNKLGNLLEAEEGVSVSLFINLSGDWSSSSSLSSVWSPKDMFIGRLCWSSMSPFLSFSSLIFWNTSALLITDGVSIMLSWFKTDVQRLCEFNILSISLTGRIHNEIIIVLSQQLDLPKNRLRDLGSKLKWICITSD
ncbi:hypothetical protein WICPIJ_006694 [Wickerhamomyces pijperi]|uniref:Uncharacterized protein n=1 Tax=Wickerhamomyces pijperi TaxID=599730 RepID=A0A9P8Q170_WICPI|nr:hypothetical protein WICPIJ_006694 [Wickerhamomyces pijperi]